MCLTDSKVPFKRMYFSANQNLTESIIYNVVSASPSLESTVFFKFYFKTFMYTQQSSLNRQAGGSHRLSTVPSSGNVVVLRPVSIYSPGYS